MSTIYILVDSSTKGSGTSKYGKSSACWGIFLNELRGEPCRVGLIYSNNEGPNKMFYVGVIRALEDCFHLGHRNCIVEIKEDCNIVIDQLNGVWKVNALRSFYDQVKGLETKYRNENRGQIRYSYISVNNRLYNKIDRCAKEFDNYLQQRILR